ncbi:MAG: PaaI family thioesterase, partial [Candidatus Binatia bacterium]|nr:PaaI family thioesterase [Candidatus Binatia bacterium]
MREDLQRQSSFGKLIGTSVVRTDPGLREIEVRYEAQPEFTNRIGTIAGGMLSAMLDSSTGLAALAVLPEGTFVMHTSLQVEYLKPASPGVLTATARALEQTDRDVQTESELH